MCVEHIEKIHDDFSVSSPEYLKYRPLYPEKLFRYLSGACRRREKAWDVVTGNGQVAFGIAKYFSQVFATDPRPSILQNPKVRDNITYQTGSEKHPELGEKSLDLICVAQATHHLDLDVFYIEVNRVLKRYGVLACWNYGLPRVDPKLDECVKDFITHVLDPSWDSKRRRLELNFRSLDFPFREMITPRFQITLDWNLEYFLGFLGSISTIRKWKQSKQQDALLFVEEKLKVLWGGDGNTRRVVFPLVMKMGIST